MTFKNHDLVPVSTWPGLRVDRLPVRGPGGEPVDGLHATRIMLDNQAQYNSYTTEMVKGVILSMRAASNDRSCVAVVFTGSGDKAFCTGGNTAEYAEYYAGRPDEYRQYMRLFNDMVTSILHCDKPVICRVNGMRIAGGQEIGMACDFSIASDLARFGQAGPKHGSAPDGGSTDFLPLFVGIERAMESCSLCGPWSAHKAMRLGLLTAIVPALKIDDRFVANPLVVTDRWLDEHGRIVHGEWRTGEEQKRGKEQLARGIVDLSLLDREVEAMVTALAMTMPGCLTKTIESVRKHKLEHWDKNRETNRAWLGLNMMTEGRAGFRAFHEGNKECREPDFLLLRQLQANGEVWGDELTETILWRAHGLPSPRPLSHSS
jgi:6-oxo-cyclohex-1-ene-carbonyl-CoA hydrolase